MAWIIRYNTTTGQVLESSSLDGALTDAQLTGGDPDQAVLRPDPPMSPVPHDRLWVVDGSVVPIEEVDSAVLDGVFLASDQAAAINTIDAQHEALLAELVGRSSIKSSLYDRKAAEARDFLANRPTSPVATDWPWLAAEIGASIPNSGDPRVDLAAAAASIAGRAVAWEATAVELENTRLAAKAAVRAATTRADVAAVLDDLTWPDPDRFDGEAMVAEWVKRAGSTKRGLLKFFKISPGFRGAAQKPAARSPR